MSARADYLRIARALEWLDAHAAQRPPLADVARAAGLSEAHFQRLFTRWVGISPKRFVQARLADSVIALLRNGRTALDTALEAGLSGPARLHDLVLHAEAVSPGDVRRGGEGLTIRYGWHETPFGDALIAATPHGIGHLAFAERAGRADAEADLRRRWPRTTFTRDQRTTAAIAARAFPESLKRGGPLALHVRGTNFQLRVWKALLTIPGHATTTYADLAHAIGAPGAPRAVGNAVGANPISWLIPCHRVLRGDGSLGGYAWGPERKRTMLAWERARSATLPAPGSPPVARRA